MSSVRNIVILILCFNLVLLVGGFNLIEFAGGDTFIDNFVNIEDGEVIELGGKIKNATPSGVGEGYGSGSIGSGVFSFFNVVALLWGFFIFLINLTFAPIAVFTQIPNMPNIVVVLLGVPLAISYILGILWFIRGVSD